MAHKALGCLTEENGNYSKARIAMLIVGIAFLAVFIWLIVLSVETNNKEHSEDKDIYECESNPCENDGICFAGKNFHRCLCPRGYTGINCEIEKPYCIIIDTYKNKWAGGKLNLSINNIEIYSSQLFKNGTQVIDECFSSFDSITIQNTVTDAWEGEIHVIKSSSQKDLGLLCSQGCENSKFNGHIVVTGSKRANCKEKACCLSGNPCKIEEDVATSTIKTPATLKPTTPTPVKNVTTSTSKISTTTKDNPKEKGWFLGEPLETCDSACKRQNLICSENEFAIHSNEQDSTDLLQDLISELGGKTSAFLCDQACAKDVPNFTEKKCTYSRCQKKSKFNCSAIPLPKDAKKQRLCYCNKEHDVSCKVTFIGGCKDHDKLRIKILRDHPYSVKECFEWCYDTKKCAGFFINNENKSCHLYKNGCTKALGKKFTYYSMNDCTES